MSPALLVLGLLVAAPAGAQATAAAAQPAAAVAAAPTPAPAAPAPAPVAPPAPLLASQRDYSDNAQRDVPIACKPGDVERQPGKTLGQVFGAAWPAQPLPSAPGRHTSADATTPGKLVPPRGLEAQKALVVVAVLVAADGAPVHAEPLCATAKGFDIAARRFAMTASYKPATVDGVAVTSPAIVILDYHGARPRGPRGTRGSASD